MSTNLRAMSISTLGILFSLLISASPAIAGGNQSLAQDEIRSQISSELYICWLEAVSLAPSIANEFTVDVSVDSDGNVIAADASYAERGGLFPSGFKRCVSTAYRSVRLSSSHRGQSFQDIIRIPETLIDRPMWPIHIGGQINFLTVARMIEMQIGERVDACFREQYFADSDIPRDGKVYFNVNVDGSVRSPVFKSFDGAVVPVKLAGCIERFYASVVLSPPPPKAADVWFDIVTVPADLVTRAN